MGLFLPRQPLYCRILIKRDLPHETTLLLTLLTLREKEVYVFSVVHYDQALPGRPRATYKVIALSSPGHPVAVIYVDALTGEVYHHQLAAAFAQ